MGTAVLCCFCAVFIDSQRLGPWKVLSQRVGKLRCCFGCLESMTIGPKSVWSPGENIPLGISSTLWLGLTPQNRYRNDTSILFWLPQPTPKLQGCENYFMLRKDRRILYRSDMIRWVSSMNSEPFDGLIARGYTQMWCKNSISCFLSYVVWNTISKLENSGR